MTGWLFSEELSRRKVFYILLHTFVSLTSICSIEYHVAWVNSSRLLCVRLDSPEYSHFQQGLICNTRQLAAQIVQRLNWNYKWSSMCWRLKVDSSSHVLMELCELCCNFQGAGFRWRQLVFFNESCSKCTWNLVSQGIRNLMWNIGILWVLFWRELHTYNSGAHNWSSMHTSPFRILFSFT